MRMSFIVFWDRDGWEDYAGTHQPPVISKSYCSTRVAQKFDNYISHTFLAILCWLVSLVVVVLVISSQKSSKDVEGSYRNFKELNFQHEDCKEDEFPNISVI